MPTHTGYIVRALLPLDRVPLAPSARPQRTRALAILTLRSLVKHLRPGTESRLDTNEQEETYDDIQAFLRDYNAAIATLVVGNHGGSLNLRVNELDIDLLKLMTVSGSARPSILPSSLMTDLRPRRVALRRRSTKRSSLERRPRFGPCTSRSCSARSSGSTQPAAGARECRPSR